MVRCGTREELDMIHDHVDMRYSFSQLFEKIIIDSARGVAIHFYCQTLQDSSKTMYGTGAGVYRARPIVDIFIPMGKRPSVFQAETLLY